MYLLIEGPTKQVDIFNSLEYIRPGFDAESIKMTIKLVRDLQLIEREDPDNRKSPLRPTQIARDELWK